MKDVKKMTDSEIVKWLSKTADSLTSFASRGGTPNSMRGYDLRDRYEDLKWFCLSNHKGDLWLDWCDSRGYHEKNNGFDFFA